ncbi:MAG: SPOR domain-containing protein [Bacteroidia bacterium]
MKISAFLFLSLFVSTITFGQVTVQTNIPSRIAPGSEVLVEVKINKGSISNFSKYQMDVPAGVSVSEGDTRTGNFTFEEQRAKIVWVSIPTEPEFIVTFKMTMPSSPGSGTFTHKFYYLAEEGKKEVEFDPINVNFDASGAKTLVSMGGKATSEPVDPRTGGTATITTSEATETSSTAVVTNSNTTPEPVKTNTEPVKTNNEPVKVKDEPVVKTTTNETPKTTENTTTKTNNNSASSAGLVFKVQIGAYGADPSPSLFKGLPDKVTVVKEGGFYKALVGRFSTKEEAVAKINELKNHGFQGFLVRYQDGIRVK